MSNPRISAGLRRFLRSREGNIAIISGLVMPLIVGFCGLAAETSFWYFRHRDIQGAADIAAYGGTIILRKGGDDSEVTAAATSDAVANGWRQTIGTITVNTPPTSGAYQNNLSVEVILTENEPRYFTRFFFGNTTVPITVRAIGTYASAGPACFLALHPTAYHAMEFWGNSSATFSACNVVSNSSDDAGFAVGGSANVNVPCAQVFGGASITANLTLTDCPSVNEHVSERTPDPYEELDPPPETSQPCITGQPVGGVYSPGRYCDGLQVNSTVTFLPGNYVIETGAYDGLRFGAQANVTATGVMFYLTDNAKLTFNGGAHMNMSAPTSGDYAGIVMFGDRTSPYMDNTFNGDGTSVVTGALYFPSQNVRFLGNFTGQNGCMQVVAATIEYTGNGTFGTNCAGTGLYEIPTPGVISLVE